MISPIDPHGPVSPDPNGQPVSVIGRDGDPSFDDFLADQSSTGKPLPGEDPPAPVIEPLEPTPLDPIKGVMPRPIRWKGGKGPAADAPGPQLALSGPPLLPQIDPRPVVPATTRSPHWSLPVTSQSDDEVSPAESGSIQDAPPSVAMNLGAVTAKALPAIHSKLTPASLTEAGADLQAAVPPPAAQAVPATGPVLAPRIHRQTTLRDSTPAPERFAAEKTTPWPSGDSPPASMPAAGGSSLTGVEHPMPWTAGSEFSGTPPTVPSRSVTTESTAPVTVELAASQEVAAPSVTAGIYDQPVSWPADPGVFTPPPVADSRVPVTVAPIPDAGELASVTISTFAVAPEISGSPIPDKAKIAAFATAGIKPAHKSDDQKSQVSVSEELNPKIGSNGTPVAREEVDVNATLTANEKEQDADPLAKRDSDLSAGTISRRTANIQAPVRETSGNLPVPGAASVGVPAARPVEAPLATPTATSQADKMETLLNHTLSAGESLRPNGSNHLEMRVRLDGGNHEVTVRMQVADDRMQVTFQTNSPELRKALEHGWEQFSADAAQASTLSLSEPRFETARTPFAPPTGQMDNPSSFSGQQNSRREHPAATFADELTPSNAARRAGFASTTTLPPAAPQPAVRRWSGWA